MIRSFEGARGVAAMLVALYHFNLFLPFGLAFPGFVSYGYLFVDLFFVLSGYVICSTYENRLDTGNDFVTFAIRRFGRLFPLLIFSTAAFVLIPDAFILLKHVLIALGHQRMFQSPGALDYVLPTSAELIATLTLTHGLGLFDKAILNYASWSISTEFYTYLVFAGACILLKARARLAAFAVLSVLGLTITCWASLFVHHCVAQRACLDVTFDYGFARCVGSYFLGCLSFYAARHYAGRHARLHEAGSQVFTLLIIASLFAFVARVPILALLFPLAFALLILSLSSDRGFVAELLKSKAAQMLGQRSYSLYLMHPALLQLFGHSLGHISGVGKGLAILAIYAVTLIVVSGLTYRFIEQPFREMFNRWAQKQANAGAKQRLLTPVSERPARD
jgi:peptidoglycan/LPS O-acetylase OafA/YrhL